MKKIILISVILLATCASYAQLSFGRTEKYIKEDMDKWETSKTVMMPDSVKLVTVWTNDPTIDPIYCYTKTYYLRHDTCFKYIEEPKAAVNELGTKYFASFKVNHYEPSPNEPNTWYFQPTGFYATTIPKGTKIKIQIKRGPGGNKATYYSLVKK